MPMPRALLFTTLLALPIAAEDPVFRVEGGLGGWIREDRWTFARVDARGGDDDFEGVAILASKAWDGSEAETHVPLQLPRKSRKRFEVYHRAQGNHMFGVRIYEGSGRKTYEEPLHPPPSVTRWAVGVLGPSLAGLEKYGQVGSNDIAAIPLRVEDLPRKPWGLDALDWLVWPEPEPQQLLPEQMEAIVEWVRSGGRLCLCVAKNVDVVCGSPLAALLPGKLDRAELTDDLQAIEKLTKVGLRPREPILVARIRPQGRVLLGEGALPLAVRKRFGLGEVLLLPFDPLAEPFSKWTGRDPMWVALLGLAAPESKRESVELDPYGYGYLVNQFDSPSAAQVWAERMESAPLGVMVKPEVFVLIFVTYVLVVGLGDYLWWKRKGRPLGLWWSTPFWVALFGYLSWRAGTAGRRDADLLRAVTVYDRGVGDTTWVHHGAATIYVGSGQRLSFVPSPAPGVLWPTAGRHEGSSLAKPRIGLAQTANGTEAQGIKMYSASMLSFLAEGRGAPPELAGLAVKRVGDDVVIDNQTDIAWADGWLLGPVRCTPIGTLAPRSRRVVQPSADASLTVEQARDRARAHIGFPVESQYYYGQRYSYYGEQRSDFIPGSTHIHALQLLLEPWAEHRRFEGKPGGIVPRDLLDPCVLLVANDGPCGVSIVGFEGERVTATAVRIWLDEEEPR